MRQSSLVDEEDELRSRVGQSAFSGAAFSGAALAVLMLTATPLRALDSLDFQTPDAPKEIADSLRAASLLLQSRAEGRIDAQALLAAARADYARLLAALYAQGYYSGVIHITLDGKEASSIAPLDVPKTVRRVQVTVQPGPLFIFGVARIAPLAPGTTLPQGFAIGQPAHSGLIQQAVGASISGWRDASHAKATPGVRSIVADHPHRRLDADVTLQPGPRVTFGKLIVTGDSRVTERAIRRIAGFSTGQPFSPKVEEKAVARLRRTRAFASVALSEADTLGPGNTLDVTAALADQKRHRVGFGAELASLDGITLSGYWLNRNLLGGAERLRLDAEISGIGGQTGSPDYSLSLRFDKPGVVTPDSGLYAQVTAERLSLTDYDESLAGAEVGLTRILSDHLTASAGVGYQVSRVSDSAGVTRYRNITFPLGLTWDNRDKPLDARRGSYLAAHVMPFVGFGGTGTGGQVILDARAYRSIGKRFTLAARVQLGSVLGASVATTPRDYLFYSGGGGTVRGQPYQSLGVSVLPGGQRSGGRSFLGLSGEVRANLGHSFGAAAFYDAGYVGASGLPDGSGSWQAGAGLGLRYDTGIGPIRLDLALPVTGGTGKGLQVYVGIGQAF